LAPHGAGLPSGIEERRSEVPASTANYSLQTANSSYTFSAKEKDVETSLSYFGSRYYSSDLSIWLSVDPMSDKYPSLSPYTYCADNPVKLVDPNGEEVSVFGNSENKNTIINSLNAHFDNITVGYDKENPNKLVIVKGTAQTEDELALAKAITDTKIDVNLNLVDGRKIGYHTSTGDDLEIEGAGAFLGNYISYSSGTQTKENIAKVHTLQCLSVSELKSLYKEKDWGQLINHEITESFQGGVISSEKNIPGRDDNWNINSNIYREAHASATPQPFTIGASWLHH
jgi:RHS repeat-associated protein